jgi:hypothetical protein
MAGPYPWPDESNPHLNLCFIYIHLNSSVTPPGSWNKWSAEESAFDSREEHEICVLQGVQAGFGAHSISYPLGTRASFTGANTAKA